MRRVIFWVASMGLRCFFTRLFVVFVFVFASVRACVRDSKMKEREVHSETKRRGSRGAHHTPIERAQKKRGKKALSTVAPERDGG
jgi:hypothetical protein